jgi:predicted alpha/beta superfamily hydrolase
LFDTYIAFDPSLWWNDRKLLAGALELLRARPPSGKTVYLASSREPDLAEVTRLFAGALDKAAVSGLKWHYDPMPGEQHSTIYHPAALRAFRVVFKPAAKP